VDNRTPTTVAARLRRARLDKSLSLADAGEALHVPARYIHAIETDDYAALPPTVYTRALIREYARYLGINPAEVLEHGLPMRPGDRNPIRPALQPIDKPSVSVSWRAIAVASGIAICIGVFAYLYSQYNSFAQSIDGGRDPAAELLPTPLARGAATARITPFATTTVVPTLTPSAIPTPVTGIVVEARLTEGSWMQVWTDNRPVLQEAVPAGGAPRVFTADQSIRMRVGNAGGIEVTVNGVNQGKLGSANQAMEVSWGREGT
jgi:cytoskeleton protein RodZ